MNHDAHSSTVTADHVPHVLPLRSYLIVWGALLALTGITVAVSYVDFGTWNLVISMLVASTKAALVAAVFMHLLYEKRFNSVVFVLSIGFLVVLIAFTFFDTSTRGSSDPLEGVRPRDTTQPFVGGKPVTQPSFEGVRAGGGREGP